MKLQLLSVPHAVHARFLLSFGGNGLFSATLAGTNRRAIRTFTATFVRGCSRCSVPGNRGLW